MLKIFRKVLKFKYTKPLFILITFVILSSATVFYFENETNDQFSDIIDAVWWSIITFSTTGYGDKVPATLAGKIIAIITVLFGLGVVSFISGTIASIFVDRNLRLRSGIMTYNNLKDHIIICGWKDGIKDLIKEIIYVCDKTDSSKILLISNLMPEEVINIQSEPDLESLKFIKGDYYSEDTLKRANALKAKKVIVLADKLESGTPSEVDSKTVMTVLAVKSISKEIFVCAEILDQKYVPHLKHAMCDEIMHTRDYNKMMIANASATDGISHILYDLLSYDGSKSVLSTIDIPNRYIKKSYKDLKTSLENNKFLLLGLLENTGTSNKMRVEAVKEAQKTADISDLVHNLKSVRKLEPNHSVLLPDDSYQIKKYSKAIVLKKRDL